MLESIDGDIDCPIGRRGRGHPRRRIGRGSRLKGPLDIGSKRVVLQHLPTPVVTVTR
ncbi:MAG: hypothetical protein MPW15_12165 [Candidatus Manganitrophus sp.]|nr:hypothetical protein [Candidatus Manganitrophus sp.]